MEPGLLTQRHLNRALLARQLLLDRVPLSLPAALDRIGGIQAQYAPSMYVGLWSRIEGFGRSDLTRALEQRAVVQGTLMRITIHLVSAGDYWPFAVSTRQARREHWLKAHRGGPDHDEMAAAAARLREHMRGATVRRAEIEVLLGRSVAIGVGLWVDLLRVPPSGTWERRRADLYAVAEDWLGPAPMEPEAVEREAVEAEAQAHLVRRYLEGFGPAGRADVASWTGLPPREVSAVLDRLELRRFRGAGGEELVDLLGAPLPDPDTPAPVRFLPVWDATLLVHARRTGILPEEHRPKIFNTKTPHSVPTFLVDGEVAGSWRYEKGAVRTEPFGRLGRSAQRAVDDEAERLAAFHA